MWPLQDKAVAKVVPDTQFQFFCVLWACWTIVEILGIAVKNLKFHLNLSSSKIVDLQGKLILERRAAFPDNYLELKT